MKCPNCGSLNPSMKKSISLSLLILVFMVGVLWAETVEEWFNKGFRAHNARNYEEAIRCYKKAIAINPDYADAHSNLGFTYQEKGMLDEAIAEYKKAIAINPKLALAHNNLGFAYQEKGILNEAIAEYKKVLAIYPNFLLSRFNLANTYSKKGMLNEAIAEYKKVIAIDPNYADAHSNLGLVYHVKGMLNEAIAEYKKVLAINPKSAFAHKNLALALKLTESKKLEKERIDVPYQEENGGITIAVILGILVACGFYLIVFLNWKKLSSTIRGLFLFVFLTPIIWLVWFVQRKREKKRMKSTDVMKKCPYCAEEIKDEATKCRFCGEWLKTPTDDTSKEQLDNEEKEALNDRVSRADESCFEMINSDGICNKHGITPDKAESNKLKYKSKEGGYDEYESTGIGKKKKRKWGWIFIAYFLLYITFNQQVFKNEPIGLYDTPITILFIILACIFYYWLKSKFKVPSIGKNILMGIITIVIFQVIITLSLTWKNIYLIDLERARVNETLIDKGYEKFINNPQFNNREAMFFSFLTERYKTREEFNNKYVEEIQTFDDISHNMKLINESIPIIEERNKKLAEICDYISIYHDEFFKNNLEMKMLAFQYDRDKYNINSNFYKEFCTTARKLCACELECFKFQQNYYQAMINGNLDIAERYSMGWIEKAEQYDKLLQEAREKFISVFSSRKEFVDRLTQLYDGSEYQDKRKEAERNLHLLLDE